MVGTPYLVQIQHLQGPVQNENSQPSFEITENFTLATHHLTKCVDSPGDTVNKNLPASAWDTGSRSLGWEIRPHMPRGNYACAQLLSPGSELCNERSHRRGKPMHNPQRMSTAAAQAQGSQKVNP